MPACCPDRKPEAPGAGASGFQGKRMSTLNRTPIAAAAAAAAAGLTLAACASSGSSQAPAPAAPPSTSQAPAPDGVAILHQAGVTDASSGGTDISGDAMANGTVQQGDCTGGCGEMFTVYSNASAAALAQNMAQLMKTPGSQAVIDGPGGRYVITVTGVRELSAPDPAHDMAYFITPAQVAQRVHGTVVVQGAQS